MKRLRNQNFITLLILRICGKDQVILIGVYYSIGRQIVNYRHELQ